MVEFKRKSRDYEIQMKLLGTDYIVNVSPTSHVLLKKISVLQDEAKAMLATIETATLEQTLATIDEVLAKEKAIMDQLLPGKWEAFYEALSGDVLDLTELTGFVVSTVIGGAARAKLESVAPVEGSGEQV